jgi:hypothetical protein
MTLATSIFGLPSLAPFALAAASAAFVRPAMSAFLFGQRSEKVHHFEQWFQRENLIFQIVELEPTPRPTRF